jgi:hypothetical protein
MATDRLASIEGTGTADGATSELTFQDDESHTIEKVQVIEEGGTTLDQSTATISIKGDSVTDQAVPVSALQENYRDLFKMDLELPPNTEFAFSFTNDSGGSVTINVVLYFSDHMMSGG